MLTRRDDSHRRNDQGDRNEGLGHQGCRRLPMEAAGAVRVDIGARTSRLLGRARGRCGQSRPSAGSQRGADRDRIGQAQSDETEGHEGRYEEVALEVRVGVGGGKAGGHCRPDDGQEDVAGPLDDARRQSERSQVAERPQPAR